MSRKSFLAAVGVMAVAAFLYFFLSREKRAPKQEHPDLGKYIAAFTSGYVSNISPIRIVLASPVPGIEPGSPADASLFGFSPSIKGTALWIDARIIEFKPGNKLPSGQDYKATFYLAKLFQVPEGLEEFEFEFSVIRQSLSVAIDGMYTSDRKQMIWQQVKGTLALADHAEFPDIEKVLTAVQDGRKLKIFWEHGDDDLHRFTVDSIIRKETPGEVIIEWDGKPVGVEESQKKSFTIPGLNEFTIMDASVIQTPEQFVRILFSDPIDDGQNLEGLISLLPSGNIPVPLKFTVDNNEIKVYPGSRQIGFLTISIETGIKNILGYKLLSSFRRELSFEEIKPQIRFIGKGVILPSTNGLSLPFEAVNLKTVDVMVTRIYENNVPQFMQVNYLDGNYELHRVGKTIVSKPVDLRVENKNDLQAWKTYHLDLSDLIKSEPGAIYQVSLNFRQEYSAYRCEGNDQPLRETDEEYGEEGDYGEYYDEYYDGGYNYRDRENPCKSSYYFGKQIQKNVIASDLGMIAKKGGDNKLLVAVTDLKTAKPVDGVTVEFLDYQQQLLGSFRTDNEGIVREEFSEPPFLLIAKKGGQRGYLRVDGYSLSMSMFDVSGEHVSRGIKGLIVPERGVWRPGDSLFLSFILEDKEKTLPENHPVVFELINPLGQQVKKIVKSENVNGFYNFSTATDPNAPTGNWNAAVTVGGNYFSKMLKIETVMPNRLKIKLDFGTGIVYSGKAVSGTLEARWLHGAIARNLKAKVEVTLSAMATAFKNFRDYIFDDPSKRFTTEQQVVFEDYLDQEGKAQISPDISPSDAAPGMLNGNFTVRVFEEGGNFSIDRFTVTCSPFKSYVGLLAPEGERYSGILFTDTNHLMQIVTVDEDGKPVDRKKITVKIYKLGWRWWWDSYDDELANYLGDEYHKLYNSFTTSTTGGKGQFNFRINRPEWGRFFIQVIDDESGHSTGKIVYVDWPYWAGRSSKGEDDKGAVLLNFTTDKEKYHVGEKVKLSVPSSDESRILISLEDGTKILDYWWVDGQKGNTEFTFLSKPEMTPNIYVHVMLIQPHAQSKNDLPIRMYGVLNLPVEDPNTHIYPEIQTAEAWRSEEKATIKVSEKNGNPMTYTLAVVDEGLLDLTRFQTPDPWKHFFAREALGVRTWDLYDWVIGAYGAEIKQLLAIGGDQEAADKGGKKANRFKPMVKFFGPCFLKKGKTAVHEFTIPRYVGSVRVMVVAGNTPQSGYGTEGGEGAYGSAEKAVPVKKPVMVLATLPRVVGPNETVDLPVTVFAMEKTIKNVSVTIKPNELFEVDGETSKTISFTEPGDEVIYFRLKVKPQIGIARVNITATSGSEKATEEIELDVRNPNPRVTDIVEAVLEPGKSWTSTVTPPGMIGTNKGTVEFSTIPPINLGYRLKYLITYPYGCIEQTTSGAFPQLYLADIMDLNSDFRATLDRNIKAAIDRIRKFQASSGGFGYWPGDNSASDWASSYAGQFLLEAESKGFALPTGTIAGWKKYQRQTAQSWSPKQKNSYYYYYHDDLMQAYRLYTLALARAPELAAMNRLKEYGHLSTVARIQLAAAYALAGQEETARQLLFKGPLDIEDYVEMSYTYGSDERDKALLIDALCLIKEFGKAAPLVKEISKDLSTEHYWMGTQSTAFCLLAVSKFAIKGGASDVLSCTYSINGSGEKKIDTKRPVVQQDIAFKANESKNVSVINSSKGILFARVILEGIPVEGDQTSAENNLGLDISYYRMDGSSMDVTNLEQGTDFYAQVTVNNPGHRGWYREMALVQIFPSGWEIHNTRMDEGESAIKSTPPTYQDIRDDRVYTYFNIAAEKEAVFRIVLNAAYTGRYYLPTITCEAMYDNTVNARKPGRWVEVRKAGSL